VHNSPTWRRYVRFWRPDIAADVDDEIEFHVQETVDDLVAHGMAREAATVEAVRRLGDLNHVKQTCRALGHDNEARMRRSELLHTITEDVRYALRRMRTNVSFTVAVLSTMALGIGAVTSIFCVVNAVLLRPLPYRDADRIVVIRERYRESLGSVAPGYIHDWTEYSTGFEAITATQPRTYAEAIARTFTELVRGCVRFPECGAPALALAYQCWERASTSVFRWMEGKPTERI
jgi:putative ABC transport system permease protein